jgi:hypothetical protein
MEVSGNPMPGQLKEQSWRKTIISQALWLLWKIELSPHVKNKTKKISGRDWTFVRLLYRGLQNAMDCWTTFEVSLKWRFCDFWRWKFTIDKSRGFLLLFIFLAYLSYLQSFPSLDTMSTMNKKINSVPLPSSNLLLLHLAILSSCIAIWLTRVVDGIRIQFHPEFNSIGSPMITTPGKTIFWDGVTF